MKKNILAHLIFVSCIVVAILSCKKSQETESVVISPENEMIVSDFVEHSDYIKLPKSDSCLIGEIQSVRFGNGMIAVQSSRKIFVFDKSGRFLGKTDHLGKGKGEYVDINDFQLYNNGIYVLSGLQKKILRYTVTGDFIGEYRLDDSYRHMEMRDSVNVILASEQCNDTHYNFVYYDLSNEKSTLRVDKFDQNEAFAVPSFNAFLGSDSVLLVGHLFDTSVYSLKENRISKVMTFNFNTQDQLPTSKKDFMELFEDTKYKNVVRYLTAYTEVGTNRYLIYPLFGDSGIKTCITRINKDGKNHTIKIGKDVDATYPYFFMGTYLCLYENQIVMAVDANHLLELEKEHDLSYFTDDGINKDDNPILFFYTLKSN